MVRAAAQYIIHMTDGDLKDAADTETLRKMITDGIVGVNDKISKDGSQPSEFYLYDEFVDLWDADLDSFELPSGDHQEGEGAQEPTSGVFSRSKKSAYTRRAKPAPVPTLLVKREPEEGPIVSEELAESAMPTPIVSAEDGPELNSDFSDAEFDEAFGGLNQPTTEQPVPELELSGAELPEEKLEDEPMFQGYDPLEDKILDPITVKDLLLDSSLYTVLAVRPDVSAIYLQDAYLNRAEVLATRQRDIPREDALQIQSLEEVRRLVYLSYEILKDIEKRKKYDEDGRERGMLQEAADYLSLARTDYSATPTEESETDTALDDSSTRDSVSTAPTPGIGIGDDILSDLIADELGEDGLDPRMDLALAQAREAEARALETKDEIVVEKLSSEETLDDGPRIYQAAQDAFTDGSKSRLEAVGELFTEAAPNIARQKRDQEQKADLVRKRHAATKKRYWAEFTGASLDDEEQALAAQRPGLAIGQAVGTTIVVCLIAMALVLTTGQGVNELDLGSPSYWFYGRCLLLIAAGVFGTTILRKNKVNRIGFWPSPVYSIGGLMIGIVVGVLAAFIAPIRLEGTVAFTAIVGLMFLQAFSHELFFRGFVTRMLLLDFKNHYSAIVLSGFMYGIFYLTYYNVHQFDFFYKLYFSILVPGLILGSMFAWFYYKSRSIWPSVIAHFMILVLARLMAPSG